MNILDLKNINRLIDISIAAGNAIMDVYETNFDIETKDDQSPLTRADTISNMIICDALSKMTPDIPILSEESSYIPFNERSKWKKYWLIDPLDGTKEFIKKNGEFTTNIALIINHSPVFGIIHAPAINETYWGSEMGGCYFLQGKSPLDKVRLRTSNNKDKIRIISSRSHPSGDLKKLLEKLDCFEILGIGSSLKFCLIAKGEADCYPRLGPTSEWDTAAGEIIAKSAGAEVIDITGQSIKYNYKDSFLNPHFIVTNNDKIKSKIFSKL